MLLLSATTGFAKDEYEQDIKEPNFRFYTIEWIDVADDNDRKYVCGTKVTTFDYSGRKFMMEYYYLLTNENKVVTRFHLGRPSNKFWDRWTPENGKFSDKIARLDN